MRQTGLSLPGVSRVTVITGGNAGIGAATARVLVSQGHRVVLAARSASRLADVAASLGAAAMPVVADVTRRADVNRVRDEALSAFGRVDVWVNNAGRGITCPVLELTDDDFTDIIDTNVRSVVYGMQAIVPYFEAQGAGHLINVSSFLARVPLAPLRSVYSAAKAAVNSLSASLAMDLRARCPGVHVSVIMPGIVDTGFAQNARGSVASAVAAPSRTPMRPQSADEVAHAIARLVAVPVPEAYTNPASPEIARQYFEDIGAFTPLQS